MKVILKCSNCGSEDFKDTGSNTVTCNKCGCSELLTRPNIKFNIKNEGDVDDGDHSFDELYYHRMILFSIICEKYKTRAWKSWKHHDGTMYDNYFIVGITTPKGDYSYHYHKKYWDMFNINEYEYAPEWDGHKPKDVDRLRSLL